jgi:hypothetical protein
VNEREQNTLIEASLTAHRQRDADGRLLPPPEWWDLAPDALDELYRRQLQSRELERLIDPRGLSSTIRAVRARLVR